MRMLFLSLLLSIKLANAQQADSILLYDSYGGFVQYLLGDSIHKEAALHAALSIAYGDSLTLFKKQSVQTSYRMLGYDTAAIKFTVNINHLTKTPDNTLRTQNTLYPFVYVNHTTKIFTILFEDVSYFDFSHKLIEEVIPVPFSDLILQRSQDYAGRLKEVYINRLYLRDWNGNVILLRNINLTAKMN